jgi:hypothetical protein
MAMAGNMPDTQQQRPLNSAELNQVLNGTTEDTPTVPEVQEPGSPDEFCTPLQDFGPRETTDDGENSNSDGTNMPVSKVWFGNPSEPNELVVSSVARLEDIPVGPTT